MRNKIIVAIILVIAGLLLITIVYRIRLKMIQEHQKSSSIVYNVGVEKAEKTLWRETIQAQAIVEGDPQVKVYPNNVNGIFMYNTVKEGDYVHKDQDIAFIDRNVPGSDFLPAPVKSPINGIVIKLYFIDRGESVSIQQPVVEIADINNLKLVITLGEADLLKCKSGQPVVITSDYSNDINLNEKIDSVTPYIDNDSFSGNITIYLKNRDRRLKIGMTVNVEIGVAERMAYVIPENAVLMGENKIYIFIVDLKKTIPTDKFNSQLIGKLKNRKDDMNFLINFYRPDNDKKNYILEENIEPAVRKRILDIFDSIKYNFVARQVLVNTGFSNKGMVEVTGDFSDGDLIITEGNFKLYDGAPVRILQR